MKAADLLALVQESSKGTKHVDGEVKTPSYDNMHTPDNHVSGKGTKEVKSPKKDFGKKRDMKNKANPGKPSKKEKGRDMGGPGKSYKRLGEAAPGRPEDPNLPTQAGNVEKIQHVIFRSVQDLDVASGRMVVAPDRLTARAMGIQPGKPINIQMDPEDLGSMLKPAVAQIKRAQTAQDAMQAWQGFLKSATGGTGTKRTAPTGRRTGGPNVYKGGAAPTPQAPAWGLQDSADGLGESYADSNSMKEKQPVKKRGPVSKTAKVRGKVSDEPDNKADPGKPKNDGKSVMGPGASPKKPAQVHEKSKYPDPYGSPGKKTKPYSTGKLNVKPEDFQKKKKKDKEIKEGLKDIEKLLGRKLDVSSFNQGSASTVKEATDPDKLYVVYHLREKPRKPRMMTFDQGSRRFSHHTWVDIITGVHRTVSARPAKPEEIAAWEQKSRHSLAPTPTKVK